MVCVLFEQRQHEKHTLREILELLREKRLCAYCGEPSEHVEHVVPRRTGLPTYTVPACAECNLIAGGKLFHTFKDKQAYIRERLASKYERFLSMDEWTEDELRGLGYNLRKKIEGNMWRREVAHSRLSWSLEGFSADEGSCNQG